MAPPDCIFEHYIWIFWWLNNNHSSLLRTFGLSATSTYNSYLPLTFGTFAMIWGHFWNVRKGRFRGHGGRRGQTTSKSKTTKILNENLLKLDEIQNLAPATSKMTSWPQQPQKGVIELFQKLHFWNQYVHQAEKDELCFIFLVQLVKWSVFYICIWPRSYNFKEKTNYLLSWARKLRHSSSFLAWCTDYKNVTFEKIHPPPRLLIAQTGNMEQLPQKRQR